MPGVAHTGGMIALVPSADDAARLAVDDGSPVDELHLTLAFLGDDVTGWPLHDRAATAADLAELAALAGGPVRGQVFGRAEFNFADTGVAAEHDACAVYLVGDAPQLDMLAREAAVRVENKVGVPAQRSPFVAHITSGYGVSVASLTYSGPVAFDRLRLALADHVTDITLGAIAPTAAALVGPGETVLEKEAGVEGAIEVKREFSAAKRKKLAGTPKAQNDGSYPIENVGDLINAIRAFGRAADKDKTRAHITRNAKRLKATHLLPADWEGSTKGKSGSGKGGDKDGDKNGKAKAAKSRAKASGKSLNELAAEIETKVMSPDPRAARLRAYWAHGKGRAKWNTFRELREHLRRQPVPRRMLDGLTANIYKLGKGHWPGRGRDEKSAAGMAAGMAAGSTVLTADEVKAVLALAKPLPGESDAAATGIAAEMIPEVTSEEDYERALADEVEWDITPRGDIEMVSSGGGDGSGADDEGSPEWDDPEWDGNDPADINASGETEDGDAGGDDAGETEGAQEGDAELAALEALFGPAEEEDSGSDDGDGDVDAADSAGGARAGARAAAS
jgi:2'-5' RNA ligase